MCSAMTDAGYIATGVGHTHRANLEFGSQSNQVRPESRQLDRTFPARTPSGPAVRFSWGQCRDGGRLQIGGVPAWQAHPRRRLLKLHCPNVPAYGSWTLVGVRVSSPNGWQTCSAQRPTSCLVYQPGSYWEPSLTSRTSGHIDEGAPGLNSAACGPREAWSSGFRFPQCHFSTMPENSAGPSTSSRTGGTSRLPAYGGATQRAPRVRS